MSIIKVPLLFAGSLGEKHLYTLYDSGANLSCINPEYLADLEIPTHLSNRRTVGIRRWRYARMG